MKYKVFFAFQMDIDDKFGKGFIQSAIEITIQKFKKDGIELILDYGFKNVPGTTVLIDEMLKKSKESDMVLVDLTFTSSKNRFVGKKISFFKKEMHISDKVADKKSPNPNVLLETGYAWAQKGHYRTLVVMNEAFGLPSELPVDLEGFRWGITYCLNEKNNSDRKEIREQLAIDFYKAFEDAIKSEMSYQIERWLPLMIHVQWSKEHPFPYKTNTNLNSKISDLREKINNYKGAIRIKGFSGSGKTRLANEVFNENEGIKKDESIDSVLYYALFKSDYNSIIKKISDLKHSEQHKIIIIDNCDDLTHERLVSDFKHTYIKLITISNINSINELKPSDFYLEESTMIEINELLINKRFSGSKAGFLIEQLGGNIANTITILESGLNDDIEIDNSIINFISEVISKENIEKGAFKFLQIIGLFGIVGISDRYNIEIESLKSIFFNTTINDNLENIIETLISKKLISKKGDFILSSSFEEELIKNWWNENKDSLNQIIQKLEGTGLLVKFIERLQSFLKDENLTELKSVLFSENSVLVNNEFTDTYEGSELLNKLVNDFPLEVLEVLTKKIEQ